MRLKLVALWALLIATPAVVAISVFLRLNQNAPAQASSLGVSTMAWPVASDFVVALIIPLCIDFVGRCMCLGTPTRLRAPLILSIAFQATGIIGMLMILIADSRLSALAILWVVALQLLSANLFSAFLADLCNGIKLDALQRKIETLQQQIRKTTFACAGSMLYAMLIACPFMVLALVIGPWALAIGSAVVLLYPALMMIKSIILYQSITQAILVSLEQLGGATVIAAPSANQDHSAVIEASIVTPSPLAEESANLVDGIAPENSLLARTVAGECSSESTTSNNRPDNAENRPAILDAEKINAQDAGMWRLFHLGVLLKASTIWLLLALPLVALVLQIDSPLLLALIALVPDFAGRILCLYAPVGDRSSLRYSITSQALALFILVVTNLVEPSLTVFAIVVAVVLQYLAANYFVRFLGQVTQTLGIEVTQPPLMELRDRLVALSKQASGFVVVTLALFLALALLLFATAATTPYGLGALLIAPFTLIPLTVILGPYLLFLLGLTLQMLYAYDTSLRHIRIRLRKIEEQRRT